MFIADLLHLLHFLNFYIQARRILVSGGCGIPALGLWKHGPERGLGAAEARFEAQWSRNRVFVKMWTTHRRYISEK